jgi:integrase
LLADLREFLEVDLQRKKLTVQGHVRQIKRFLREVKVPLEDVSARDVRSYLSQFNAVSPNTYKNVLSALKVFFRDFLDRPEVVVSFKFPYYEQGFKKIPSKPDLQKFYSALEDLRCKCYFLLYATSALRRREAMALLKENIDLKRRMIIPGVKNTRTKRRLFSFFNEETETVLSEYLASRKDDNPKLLPISEKTFRKIWKRAYEKTGILIAPQLLRDWFCNEMGELSVPDRYIDAFCGRVPRSILARHYTDYSPEKLKRIYDKADLKVLN